MKSAATNAPSTVLFWSTSAIPDELKTKLAALKTGNTAVASKPNGLAIDFVRSGWIKTSKMTPVPPDFPGADNDLKDKLEDAVVKAIDQLGSVIYAFGEKWGPETNKKDKYFKFLPGNGIHDIHMNQGNDGKYKKDNGICQDGALIFQYPNNKWLGFFLAFQSQTFDTDNQGNPNAGNASDGATKPIKKKPSKKKPAKSKPAMKK